MKITELNIGLSTPNGGKINFVEVLNSLNARGFNLITYRLQDSVCKDGIETCLAVKTECPDDWQTQLASLSDKFGQDCIAVVGFIGHAPYDCFAPSLWVEPAKVEETELEKYRSTLREILTANRWKIGSKQAIAAEYAFTLGIESVKGSIAYLSICRLSGRSILE